MPDVTYLGIRHHGPGSARRMLDALREVQPSAVLIEGPADLSDLLKPLIHPDMVPPVALLAYAANAPERASFWPFAEFSPEYQAMRWALKNQAELRFIDLPASLTLAKAELSDEKGAPEDAANEEASAEAETEPLSLASAVSADPIGTLALAAGYEDGESWWSDVIEENPDPGLVFQAVETAMTALREGHEPEEREAQREAYMRLEIADALKKVTGPVVVICGAWHVPALKQKVKLSNDRALLKGLPKTKIKATWAPWTLARLAFATGYGAGVAAPQWYAHLWSHGTGPEADALWVAEMAKVLRQDGDVVSTASLIETVRLTRSLAAIRGRPAPGFEEMRDAAISTLMMGETLPWRLVETRLLLGKGVGRIPPDLPLAPLLNDLQTQQKKLRLKPEALERELSLDLRSDSGLARSTLLHRLNALGVPWGQLNDPGRSRGTFREKWVIAWDPEYAVRLVENLVYGPTIAAAAQARLSEQIRQQNRLSDLAQRIRDALVAQLPEVARIGTDRLEVLAAQTDDCATLLGTIPPIVDTLRYGTARAMQLDRMGTLLDRLAVQAGLALPYASRNLDSEEAVNFRKLIIEADRAIALAERNDDIYRQWISALRETGMSGLTTPPVGGLCARLAYEAHVMDIDETSALMSLRLSAATPTADAAGFFEGFFSGTGMKLVHDAALRQAVDSWMLSLDEDAFTENLPLFRRVFSTLDGHERKTLLDHLLGRAQSANRHLVLADRADELWRAQRQTIEQLFGGGRS
ncbi:MAG: DUF5682 family protein [Stappiaceae bacterium]